MKSYTEIAGIKVETKIVTTKFCCDYEKCHGACCNQPIPKISLNGGYLLDGEAAEILYRRRTLSLLCDEGDRQIALEQPVTKDSGMFFTTLKKEKCIFCNMREGTCALKIAKDKEIDGIDIPLSCQLYPILWEESSSCEILRLGDTFDDYCRYGYEKGERDNIYLIDFLRLPIIRGLGEDFFNELKYLQREYL